MTARVLSPDEWGRLEGTEAGLLVAVMTDAARVVVVEHEGQIVGCQVLQPILHAEGLWVHPDYRKRGRVLVHLWRTIRATVRDTFDVEWFATGCGNEEVRRIVEHLGGVKLPDHYMVPVGER